MAVKVDGKGYGFALDPEMAPVVREMAERYIAGWSLHQIGHDLNERKIPTSRDVIRLRNGIRTSHDWKLHNGKAVKPSTWTNTTVRKVLDSLAVLGLAVHKGQPLTDADGLPIQRADGIITREQFTAVQPKIAANQSRGEPRQREPALPGRPLW